MGGGRPRRPTPTYVGAICSNSCGCTNPRSALALSLPQHGCGDIETTGTYRDILSHLPCADAPKDDPLFLRFLENIELAAKSMPLDYANRARLDAKYLRLHGCDYLRDSRLWDSMNSVNDTRRDAKNESLIKPPYLLGRNICVRDPERWFPDDEISEALERSCSYLGPRRRP